MKAKRKIALLLVTIIVAMTALAGCGGGGGDAGSSGDVLSRIKADGTIKVAISLGNEPWCWKNEDGEIVGLAVDLIQGFADAAGIQVAYDTYDFSGLIPAIQEGKDDIIATNLTRKAERALNVTYTDPVGCSFGTCIYKKGAFNSAEDLNKDSVQLTTEVGSIYESVGTENFPNAKMNPTENNSDALAAVKAGRADAMVTDLAIATAACKADDSLTYLTPYIFTDTLAFAVGCSADSYTLAEAFNTWLKVAKADGTYAALYEKYFDEEWSPQNDATM